MFQIHKHRIEAHIIPSKNFGYSSQSYSAFHPRMEARQSPKAGPQHFLSGGDVMATLHFYKPPSDGSETSLSCDRLVGSSGAGVKNYGHDPKQILIRDIRLKEDFSFSLHSYAAVFKPSTDRIDFSDPSDVELRYGPMVEVMIFQHLPDSLKVVTLDMTIRKASQDEVLRRPVRKVHVDQSPSGAYN